MNDSEYNQKVDETLQAIDDALEHCDADLDWDLVSGILTIICDNGSQVIINRQAPTQQIWVATRKDGYHFDYHAEDDSWRQGELELYALLNQALGEQSGETVELK